MINQKRCVQYCNIELLKSGNCVLKSNETLQEKLLILNENNNQTFLENIKDLISNPDVSGQLNDIVNGGEDILLSNNNSLYQITSTGNQKNSSNLNISTINLGECETSLKTHYNISLNKSLLILKVESFIPDYKIPIIQYEIFNPDTKVKLELSYCEKAKVEVNIPVSIDENSLYIYEPNSDYYNDRCLSFFSEKGTDIPLKSRREAFINQKRLLCEADCIYLGYNNKTKTSKCQCDYKNEISLFNIKINADHLKKNFETLANSNIDIIKCYYLLFKKENIILFK